MTGKQKLLAPRLELARKLMHIVGACMFIWLALLEYNLYIWAIAVCLLVLDVLRLSGTLYGMWVRGAIRQLSLDTLFRPEEATSFTGATHMAISAAICATIFDLPTYVMGFLTLAFADPVATLIGRAIGRNPTGGGKTLEGSAAFFTTAVLIMVLLAGVIGFDDVYLMITVIAAGAATFAELFAATWRMNDNLAIPLVFGLTIYLMLLLHKLLTASVI